MAWYNFLGHWRKQRKTTVLVNLLLQAINDDATHLVKVRNLLQQYASSNVWKKQKFIPQLRQELRMLHRDESVLESLEHELEGTLLEDIKNEITPESREN